MRLRLAALAGATTVLVAATEIPSPSSGDAANGARLYQACMGCHSIEENDIGPSHRGVVGRSAGTVPGYAYSPAIKGSGLVWTPANLDKWLTDPQVLVPGTKMYFSVSDPRERADIIAFLASQK
ncbi:cytochrome c class I [Novosphingobium nitrogenifigens DSM 19370]|uniref:Cytochrome c class I n=1 Tax=Novosphingobium nitrogenifigens DSM 19370 TaxID=983920 RepID=F1ZCE1_9SPHN|nr:cytochrome c family protein [Novosphingobium nitrogenifigens]EGD57777.1 cytochrome c class I [Novosphingobium nitrogenifigens DSM 19370]